MRRLSMGTAAFCLACGVFATFASTSIAADTHVIVGTQDVTWAYNGKESAPNKPLVVDDLKTGDIVEIQIPKGDIPHGFVTTKKDTNGVTVITKEPVLACGEDKNAKSNAVLREIDCGAASQFGVKYTGSMRLEVLDKFKDQVDFFCVVHHAGMPGALKLKK